MAQEAEQHLVDSPTLAEGERPAPDSPAEPHTEPTPELAIDAQGVSKSFGANSVLRDLHLQVRQGEIFGLIGPSGSGKSTTVHILCSHLLPQGGRVRVLGEEPQSFSEHTRSRIGYMAQGFILQRDLTIRQNVSFAAGLYGLWEWQHRKRIQHVLELVELWEARNRPARNISGGMQRRLALAAALVHDPDLLFADEPTANLDPILRGKLWTHFHAMSDQGKSLLITTQYIDEAENCDRVGLMYDGSLIAEGRPEELRRKAFGGDIVDVILEQPPQSLIGTVAGVEGVHGAEASLDEPLRLTVDDAQSSIPRIVAELEKSGAKVRSIAQYRPTFDEVFIRLIEQYCGERPPMGGLLTSHPEERE